MKFIIIDVQGFKTSVTNFTPKELAAFDGTKYFHVIFEQPFPFECLSNHLKKSANWLIKNHHCINWNQGFTPLNCLQPILQQLTQNIDIVFVKGLEKSVFIRNLVQVPVIDLGNLTTPIQARKPLCYFHSTETCICALSNVFFLYQAILNKNY